MNQKIRVLVVDDEQFNREELIYLLSQYQSIEIIGEADSGESCLVQAMRKHPEVVFLDIEMPVMSGLQTAELLLDLKKPPLLVFATAYPDFAVQAFRYEAIDYILKPYDEDLLEQTVQRIEKKLNTTTELEHTNVNKLGIEVEGEVIYIDPNDILYLHSEEKQVKVFTKTSDFVTKKTLKELEARLSSYPFLRTHKSYVVNLDHVSRLTPWFNGAYNLSMKGKDEQLPVSRNYVKTLREILEL
ncbi:LytR/AlgR family response regulator transcription factor [Ornithinibacillus halophilus]|uniref:Two component transcriptional regulator, LytTR family n=1 Tax=Ornithinibacillus halophilus TaxID=930117 RepID=A0A1M5IIP9_9BACI|nr:LytTR family DNA-binding domain-containing protein [Ornithinibacillus halophilus]SHG28141.1 two component transcriptional regulator, LytTR family [Ornithinibacillus halophilus]